MAFGAKSGAVAKSWDAKGTLLPTGVGKFLERLRLSVKLFQKKASASSSWCSPRIFCAAAWAKWNKVSVCIHCCALPAELAEVLKKLPCRAKVCDVKNLRKAFVAACVKVGSGRKTGPEVWQYRSCHFHGLRWSRVRISSDPGPSGSRDEDFRAPDRVHVREV